MQIDRMFETIYLLLEKGCVTAGELAERFEVSKRTVMRDIDALTAAGVPIVTFQGRNGGISVNEDFVLNKTQLTKAERSNIIFALQSLAATQDEEVEGALKKLKTFFQQSDSNWIEIDFSRWHNATEEKEKFKTIKECILNGNAICFGYASASGETANRKVYPLKLMLKANAWYLQAFCLAKNDYRTFKLTRMYNVVKSNDNFDSGEYSAPPINRMNFQNEERIKVKLWFSAGTLYRLYEEFDRKSITENSDGSYTVETDFANEDWFYGYLLTFGTNVKVLEPPIVRETLLNKLKKIENFYYM